MSFLEPLFLIGLLAAALPVVVHLFNRRKAVKVPFPALRLLQESNKRTARSIKVRQWLLMAARILGLLLLALALAKPFILSSEGLAEDDRLPTASVLVLDDSASMHHGTWWKRARTEALEQLDRARPWDEVAMITTSGDEALPERLDARHDDLKKELASMNPSERRGEMERALKQAASLLQRSDLPQKRIVLLSDAAGAQELVQRDLDVDLLANTLYLPARDGEEERAMWPDNLAITNVRYEQDGGDSRQWKIRASVKNLSKKPKENIDIQLSIGEDVLSASRIDTIAPGEEHEQEFVHRQEGQISAPARVELVSQDGYALDDVYHFVFCTRARINALLVNGETSSVVDEDELFFLTRALNPSRSTTEGIIPHVITQEGLLKEELADYDAVILANVPRLSKGAASKLERYVKDGGGVMFLAGDQIDINAYNSTLGELLPKPLRTVKEFAVQGDPDAPVKVTRIGATNPKHPIFRTFNLPGGETLQSAEIYSSMLFDPTPTKEAETVLYFKDNSPAMLERQVEQGRVLFFATSADMEWTTLPIRSAYVPLMQRSVEYLARRASNFGDKNLRAGSPIQLDVSGLVNERAIVRGPLHEPDAMKRHVLEPRDGLVAMTPARSGVYEVWAESDEEGKGTRLEDLSFAVNVPAEESNLVGVKAEVLRGWLDNQVVHGDPAAGESGGNAGGSRTRERRINIWPKLLFFFTLLLLAETILGTRRSLVNRVLGRGEEQI